VRGSLPRGPVVWAGNHHSWWDGFAAASVLRAADREPALLMDGDNLGDYGFLRRAGVIPATAPRAALDALREDRVLIVFPEGELRPAGPLGPLLPGAEWLARRAPAALVAVALRVANRGHQWAEIYLDLSVVPIGTSLAEAMGAGLARLDADLLASDPREPLPGFLLTVPGKSSWDERITRWSSVLPRRSA
jgi:1-acyl-sn-glycerol-3-phosphate acyltransferase